MITERVQARETGALKYARVELERRWLIDSSARPSLDGLDATLIEDRYIDGTRMRLRRMTRPGRGQTRWKLTKKYECEDPSARPIATIYVTEQEFDVLRGLPARELVKRRYHLQVGDLTWSVDIFEGSLQGLELIECEAEDRDALAALVPPDWALREITDLPQWQSGALAQTQAIPEE